MSTVYSFYGADNIVIFPSSNAKDKGKLTSEDNLHGITVYAGIRNHTILDTDFTLSFVDDVVHVAPGIASINGYVIVTDVTNTLALPENYSDYYIVLRLIYDDSHHVFGDNDDPIYNENEGVSLEYAPIDAELSNDYLILGTIHYPQDGPIIVEDDPNKRFKFIADEIGAIDPDPEDGSDIDDGTLVSLQYLLYRLPYRYVSKLHDDMKLNKLNFVDNFDNITKSILVDPNNNLVKFTANNREFALSSNALNIKSNNTPSLDTIFGLSSIDTTLSKDFSAYTKTILQCGYNLNNTSNILKFDSTGIHGIMNTNERFTLTNSLAQLFNLSIAGNTLSAVTGNIILGSNLSSNYYLDGDLFKSSTQGFQYNGSSKSAMNGDISTQGTFKATENADFSTPYNKNYSTLNQTQLVFNRKSAATDTDAQIVFQTDGTAKTSIGSKHNSGIIDMTGNVAVSGEVHATRVWEAVYNDYAELYEKSNVDEFLEPGDVIALQRDGKYGKCIERNSNLVVGVYSDTYGQLLGGEKELTKEENLRKYIPVGLSGRVYVKCITADTLPGDLLVASEFAGYAMVNNFPAPGAVIGKALSKNKDGKVLMQVMLA